MKLHIVDLIFKYTLFYKNNFIRTGPLKLVKSQEQIENKLRLSYLNINLLVLKKEYIQIVTVYNYNMNVTC